MPPDRRAVLLEEHVHGPGASEPVKEFTHSQAQPLICFASFEDGVITHVALARAGTWAGSRLRRLHLKDLTELPAPVRFDDVLPKIPRKLKAHVAKRIQSGGLLPPASFDAFVDAVRELSPGPMRTSTASVNSGGRGSGASATTYGARSPIRRRPSRPLSPSPVSAETNSTTGLRRLNPVSCSHSSTVFRKRGCAKTRCF